MPSVLSVAYASNLHPLRIRARVPSAKVLGVVQLEGYALAFHKRSKDGSGKGMLYADSSAAVFGVLYEIDSLEKPALDRAEGLGSGYIEQKIQVSLNNTFIEAHLYMADPKFLDSSLRPYHWYKHLVVVGAQHHGLPDEYVRGIEQTPSIDDPDAARVRSNEDLLTEMGWKRKKA